MIWSLHTLYYAARTAGDFHDIQSQTSSDFAKLPLDGKLNTQEINVFKGIVLKKKKTIHSF